MSAFKPIRVAVMLDLVTGLRRHTEVFAGVHQFARQMAWEVSIDEYADDTLGRSRRGSPPYDGVVARSTRRLLVEAKRLRVPVVNVWHNSPVRDDLPGVFPDFAVSGRLRAEHLLSRGLRRFAAFITRTTANQLELNAFRNAIEAEGANLTVSHLPLHFSSTVKQWRKTEKVIAGAMKQWETPIGVFIANEDIGRMTAQMCRQRGLRVPTDVAIITGWNEETFCEQPNPSLSSIELGSKRIGYEAARLLQDLIAGKPPPTSPLLLPPQAVIARESTDFYAVKDETVAAALRFIAKHCHKRIGINDVAKAVSTELRTLQNYFRRHLDRSIASEIRRVRIVRAKRELTQSDDSIADIARRVGFGESIRMYEVFRRELGVSPSKYRSQRKVNR